MAIVHMKRIEIVSLLTDGKSIMDRLQRRGVVELLQYELTDKQDEAEKVNTAQSVQSFERNIAALRKAVAILDEYAPEKQPFLAAFGPRIALTAEEFENMAKQTEDCIRLAEGILTESQKITEFNAGIKSSRQAADFLESWRPLDISMRFNGTAQTKAFIGTLPGLWERESLLETIKSDSDADIPVEVQVIYSYPEQSGVFILCHKEYEQECSKSLRELGFALPLQMTDKPPAEAIAEYEQEIKRIENETKRLKDEIISAGEKRREILFAVDYLTMRSDKYKALENIVMTRRAMIIQGYVPEEDSAALVSELEDNYPVSVTVSDPAEDEEPPVAFKNKMPAAALEDITESYSMPSRSDVDPNAVMAVFYYAFFGLMLSDAGYGVLMALGTGLILHFKKPEGIIKRNMQKFMLCGLSTVFWGALFGSWFGSFVWNVTISGHRISLSPLWFDPVAQSMKLLAFSLFLGFIQVVVGLGVKFYILWRSGKRWDAIFDVGFWWVVFAGLIFIIASSMLKSALPLKTIGTYAAAAGALGLLLTQGRASKSIAGKIIGGIGSLYGITGYFSDILSYCRLMALGLVTGIIGTVVNTIGWMGGHNFGGTVLFILVFIFGHSINFAINALGAYVHCNRLQYVEFFNKFYEGGGRLFAPLKVNTKHFKLEEENTNA